MMDIYIDVLFFINFVSDFLILSLCDSSFSKKTVIKRIFASCIGSLYACMFVFNLSDVIYSLAGKIVVSVIMCIVSFYPLGLDMFLKKYLSFIIISIMFSGVFFTINSFFSFSDVVWTLSIFSSFIVCKFAFYKIKSELYSKDFKIKIKYKDNSVSFTGMVDTGNALTDPATQKPVLVIDESILKNLFSKSATDNNICEFVDSKDFRVIPYKTISDSGVTFGFVPDKLIINGKEIKNTVVAVAPSKISSGALINTKIIWKDW